MRHEVDADTFRADETDDLLDLLDQRGRRVREQEMRLVEKKDEPRFVAVTNLGEPLEELGQDPEKKRRVDLRRSDQFLRGKHIHHPAAPLVGLQEVVHVKHRLAEEGRAALLLDLEQRPLDGPDRRDRHMPVLGGELARVLTDQLQHRPQIFQIEDQQPRIVGHLEHQREHTLLRRVDAKQTAEKQRPQVGHRGTHRHSAAAEHIPEHDWRGAPLRRRRTDRFEALGEPGRQRTGGGHARQVAFDVGDEHGNTGR